MKSLSQLALVLSAVSAVAIGSASTSEAKNHKDRNSDCVDVANCDENVPRQRRNAVEQNDSVDQNDVGDNNRVRDRKRRDFADNVDWRYDRNRHDRRRDRDAKFRFFFNGFFYPQAYWLNDGPSYDDGPRYGISCREGRNIVDDRGYNRVRTVECNGRTYTYTARRAGQTYRILLNSRSGAIVSRRAI